MKATIYEALAFLFVIAGIFVALSPVLFGWRLFGSRLTLLLPGVFLLIVGAFCDSENYGIRLQQGKVSQEEKDAMKWNGVSLP